MVVKDVIKTFEQASDIKIPYTVAARREGDLPEFYADANLALKELDWRTELNLERMVTDASHCQIWCMGG